MKSGIYKILNKVTEKFYIGSAVNFKARWTAHKAALNRQDHKNKALQASWNLHGEEAFEFIILEHCERAILFKREQFWIDWTNCCDRNIGYNLFPIAGSALGTKWTEERRIATREHMLKFRHTEEAKARMREIQSSRPKEIGRKISAGKMGHQVSEETKAKIAKGNSGKIRSEAHKEAIVKANRNKIVSIETRLKLRNVDKWPHDLGARCNCDDCRIKKNKNLVFRRNRNKERALNVQSV